MIFLELLVGAAIVGLIVLKGGIKLQKPQQRPPRPPLPNRLNRDLGSPNHSTQPVQSPHQRNHSWLVEHMSLMATP